MKKILICAPSDEVPNYIAAVRLTGMEPVACTALPAKDGSVGNANTDASPAACSASLTEDADGFPTACSAPRMKRNPDIADFAGLILPGGSDMDPAFYGEGNRACRNIRRWLDEAQLNMLDAFVKCKKPVLGICKGAQVINVYFGGTLIQDLPDHDHHQAFYVNHERRDAHHPARILAGTPLSDIYSDEEIIINSAHHQAVDRVAKDLKVCAYSDDGVIEGLYHKSLPILALQWHPERMAYGHCVEGWADGSLVFQYFKEQLK